MEETNFQEMANERPAQTSNMGYTNIQEIATRERLVQTSNVEYRNMEFTNIQ